jgi:hypothetical protein
MLMRSMPSPLCRALSAALAALYLALTLGAGAHRGPHLDGVIAELPADLHHHAYGLEAAGPEGPAPLEDCVACHLSRLELRLLASGPALSLTPDVEWRAAEPAFGRPGGGAFVTADPRAPPRA